jgi:multidrug transporter EmrE-like cation transporter
LIEASSVAFLGFTFFQMPVGVAYCFGYTIASVGPAILLTIIMKMFRTGYRKVPLTILSSSILDDNIALIG